MPKGRKQNASPPLSQKKLLEQATNLEQENNEFKRFSQSMGKIFQNPLWMNSILKDFNTKSIKYKRDDIEKWMQNPASCEQQLREVHQYLMNQSLYYKRIINYFYTMLTFDYFIYPVGVDSIDIKSSKFKADRKSALNWFEKFNVKDELNKPYFNIVGEDIAYYYRRENGNTITLQKMPSDYCKLVGRTNIGFQYAFNLVYFYKMGIDVTTFPEEIQTAYNQAEAGKLKDTFWVILSDNAVAFKFNEDSGIIAPPFLGLFLDCLTIAEFKDLIKTKAVLENWKILFQRIPQRNDKDAKKNDFLIGLDKAAEFHENVKKNLPEGVSVVTTPMEISTINFEHSQTKDNLIGYAEDSFYKTSGTSKVLFSGDQTGSIGVSYSIKSDENFVINLYRQFERWINWLLDKETKKYKFKICFPDITRFNQIDKQDSFLKAAEYGLPKTPLIASYGLTPSMFEGLTAYENEIDITTLMHPLVSSHTQNATNAGGAPIKKEDKLTDGGAKTRDSNGNDNRAG